MKVVAFINRDVRLPQADELLPDKRFEGHEVEFIADDPEFDPVIQDPDAGRFFYSYRAEFDHRVYLMSNYPGGTVIITSTFLNISRYMIASLQFARDLIQKKIRFISLLEGFDSSQEMSKKLIEAIPILEAYDEQFSMESLGRQREGIERAKKENKYSGNGRKGVTLDDFPEFDTYYQSIISLKITKRRAAEILGISRPTLDKLIKMKEEQAE